MISGHHTCAKIVETCRKFQQFALLCVVVTHRSCNGSFKHRVLVEKTPRSQAHSHSQGNIRGPGAESSNKQIGIPAIYIYQLLVIADSIAVRLHLKINKLVVTICFLTDAERN